MASKEGKSSAECVGVGDGDVGRDVGGDDRDSDCFGRINGENFCEMAMGGDSGEWLAVVLASPHLMLITQLRLDPLIAPPRHAISNLTLPLPPSPHYYCRHLTTPPAPLTQPTTTTF